MKKIFFIIIAITYLCSCSEYIKPNNSKLSELKSLINKLQDKIEELENKSTQLKYKIAPLQAQINMLSEKVSSIQNPLAIFTPSSKGYTTINTNNGNFLVSLDSLTKYANGYKAVFNIGNPNLVTFNGVKINVAWGKDNSSSKFKTNNVTINKPILPGVWNKVSVVLSPATANETGIIVLTLSVDKILLTEDYRKAMT